jgi:hypothetical protein
MYGRRFFNYYKRSLKAFRRGLHLPGYRVPGPIRQQPRACRGWHYPDRVEPGVPEVLQQATRLTHVSGKLKRAKHALPLAVLKEQELVVHQNTHHGSSRRDGGSVVCVDR